MEIIFNNYGMFISAGLLILAIFLHLYNFGPKFILPQKLFNKNKAITFFVFKYLLLVCLILLPLNFKFLTGKKLIVEKFVPIQIIFDVSLSMTANDINPSRFIAAKNATYKLIQKLDGYDISLIAFSGIPFVYIPFSNDTNVILDTWQKTNLGDFPPTSDFVGTAIGDALLLGLRNMNSLRLKDENKPGIIILITDGDSNKGYDPLQVIPIIQKKNIAVFTLGVGEQDYLIGHDKYNNPVKTSINIELLQEISGDTGGEFYRVLEYETFDKIFNNIASMIKTQEKNVVQKEYFELNNILLFIVSISLIYLISINLLSLTKKQ